MWKKLKQHKISQIIDQTEATGGAMALVYDEGWEGIDSVLRTPAMVSERRELEAAHEFVL
ncbi:hypothetical protein LOAG_13975 [Loa loa]|uniref:Uncharacterized protein n=1 Tax=Loa loa TaxID=7209 RepID=A0A1I7VE16_LOALO|nr:hypothetical protein LOAG_13975 [Loa loa]EFO14542.1 hypothetical protein LOAG_13975 [Loa loa]